MNLSDYVPAFVKAYYTNVLKSPHDVKKFYSGNATYFRSYMNSNSSVPVDQEKVCPHISPDSTLTIKNFVSAPIPKCSSISVSVFGAYQYKEKVSCFSQNFILQEIGKRICIVSDIYNEFNQTDFNQENHHLEPTSQLTENQPPAQSTNTNANTNANANANTNTNANANTNVNANINNNSNNNSNNNNQNRPQSKQGRNRNRNKNKNNSFVYTPD